MYDPVYMKCIEQTNSMETGSRLMAAGSREGENVLMASFGMIKMF